MITLGLPDSSGMSKPPPTLNGLNTMALAVSKKNGAIVISAPVRRADANAVAE
jgi:hypothetical protein